MPTSIRLSPELEIRLAKLALLAGRSKSFLLREMIGRGIEDAEDYYSAIDVLTRVAMGTEPIHSAAEVRRDLGLSDTG